MPKTNKQLNLKKEFNDYIESKLKSGGIIEIDNDCDLPKTTSDLYKILCVAFTSSLLEKQQKEHNQKMKEFLGDVVGEEECVCDCIVKNNKLN